LAEIACGDFSRVGRGDPLSGWQKAWLLPARYRWGRFQQSWARRPFERLAKGVAFASSVSLGATSAELGAATLLAAGKKGGFCQLGTIGAQPAKTTLFAGGNGADVRKTAAGRFSNRLGRVNG
jgi:hypothetical protein